MSPRSPARTTHRPLTVAALMCALFMSAMEMTVVSTAMPTVVAELGGALHYAWVFSAYMLAVTVAVPIYGKLADVYGRKPVLLVGVALFLVGSMASGQATTMNQLIAFRVVQGLGAGGMQPVAITIVGDIYSVEERGKMQGVFGAVWAIAGLIGPLLGGVIVATMSWRWVFYVNVPFGLFSAGAITWGLVESVEKKNPKLDFAGAATLSLAIVALLLGVDGVMPAVLVPASLVLAVVFLVIERRAPEPMLPLSLFSTRAIATSSALSALSGGAMIGLVTFVPLYAQGVLGATPTEAGTAIAPMAIAWPIASGIGGRLIAKVGFRALVRFGSVLVAIAGVWLASRVAHGASQTELRVGAAVFGAGMGFGNTALLIAVQSSVTFAQRGVATASTMFFRTIGGTLAVGAMGVILARVLLAGVAGQNTGGAELVARILGPDRRTVAPETLQAIAGDLSSGLASVHWSVAGLSVLGAVVAFWFPAIQTPTTPRAPAEAARQLSDG